MNAPSPFYILDIAHPFADLESGPGSGAAILASLPRNPGSDTRRAEGHVAMTKPRARVTSQPIQSRARAGAYPVSERTLVAELEQQLRTALIFRVANWPPDSLVVGPGERWPDYVIARIEAPRTVGELYRARRLFGDAALRSIRWRTASSDVRAFIDRALGLP